MTIDESTFSTSGQESPAGFAAAVAPADTDLAGGFTRGLYVGGTGDVAVLMAGDQAGSVVTFTAVPAGTILPIRVSQVRLATTATLIIALW